MSQVGSILISYSLARAIISAFAGKIVIYAGRKILIPSAGVLTATLLIVLRLWTPNPESQAVTHVIAATLGVCLALWNTQLSGKLSLPDIECTVAHCIFRARLYKRFWLTFG